MQIRGKMFLNMRLVPRVALMEEWNVCVKRAIPDLVYPGSSRKGHTITPEEDAPSPSHGSLLLKAKLR